MPEGDGTILFEDARIIFPNFKGLEGTYNREGDRSFGIIIEDYELARVLEQDGWNIKYLRPREGEELGTPWMSVNLKYGKGRAPHVVMVTSKNRTVLDEETVGMLDDSEIKTVDVLINPYAWNVRGESGIKGYVKTMFVTIAEDYLQLKWGSTQESEDTE